MINEIICILEERKVRATPMRMLVLEQMILYQEGVTLNTMENLLIDSDRITIYRTLQTFVKHGIAHAVEMANKGTVYILCSKECSLDKHYDYHPHFSCEKCGKIFCGGEFPFEISRIPNKDDFTINTIEIMIKGLCSQCLPKKQ